ncbi:MAG: complex I subunit 1/NuoH family protein, partial [Bryobacteraceae bacterium]
MNAVLEHPLTAPLLIIAVIILVFPLMAGYIVLVERKVLADMQVRLGPMRVGPHGLLQPLADALKLLLKEDTVPAQADKPIFWIAPIISVFTGLTAFAVLPFSRDIYITDVNVGLLVISAMGAVGILGIILGGWSSNSHYPLLGALRSAAQLVSYEVALSLALLSGVMMAGSLSMVSI